MREETIVIRNLSTGYKGKKHVKVIAREVNATICSGELTCLLGANGAGKSTLLKTLSAFLHPLGGEIWIQGKLWLLDIRGGLTKPELDFIKEHVSKPLFVVLTYTDRMDDNSYYQALSVIADGFKRAEVDVKGYVRYNKYEEDKFRREFNETINTGISQLEIGPQNPYSYVNLGVSYIRHILKANEEFYTKTKNEANSEVCQYQNSVENDCERLNEKINTLVRRTNELIDHWRNNWIAGDGFKVKINSLSDGVKYVINAWNDFELKNIMELARSSRNEQEAIYKLQLIEGLKEDFENSIGKLFKE